MVTVLLLAFVFSQLWNHFQRAHSKCGVIDGRKWEPKKSWPLVLSSYLRKPTNKPPTYAIDALKEVRV